ncbi:unnamed protein product [Arabidopsis lyrata]|nr:unnamed protein product [Arabidopsis lyrata]
MEDVNGSDRFSFEIKQPYVEERLDNNKKREEVAVDAVSFVAETENGKEEVNFVPKKLIIVVTPTYNRAMQAYYLNRIAQTLRLVESPVLKNIITKKGQLFPKGVGLLTERISYSCLRIIDTARCPSARLIACSLKTDKLPLGAAVSLSGGPVVKRSLQKRQIGDKLFKLLKK